jgi:hypothetical protein
VHLEVCRCYHAPHPITDPETIELETIAKIIPSFLKLLSGILVTAMQN